MSKTRHILAVVAVATALCADQAIALAPTPKPNMGEIAARLVERLAQPFRQSVPGAVRRINRSGVTFAQIETPGRPVAVASTQHCELLPFQFRLPPPMA